MEISVIIPAYNEEERIGTTVVEVHSYLKNNRHDFEIIVVDDGSTDKTVSTVRSLGLDKITVLSNKKNIGKGGSVKNGMMHARKTYRLFSDADLSTPIRELEKFIPSIENYDIIIGSRNMKESEIKVKQPMIRSSLGKIFPYFVNLMLGLNIKDTQCGFKLFHEKTMAVFEEQQITGFAFDAEVLMLAKKHNFNVKEVPIVWFNDTRSKVSPITDSLRMLRDVVKVKFF